MNTYICRYCRQPSDPNSPICPMCGAPVDIRSSVSDSGWVEQPRDQGHGTTPVRPVPRPDRGHDGPGRGVQPCGERLGLLLPPCAAVDRAADQADQHGDARRVEPQDGRAMAQTMTASRTTYQNNYPSSSASVSADMHHSWHPQSHTSHTTSSGINGAISTRTKPIQAPNGTCHSTRLLLRITYR